MKALILSAGKGKNLLPFTASRSKSMINLSGRFILEDKIKMLKESGINVAYIVVGHKREMILQYFGDNEDHGVNIHYLHQNKNPGIGGAVMLMKEKINPGEYFVLVYGDVITSENIIHYTLQSFNRAKGPIASVCLTQSNEMFGNVYFDGDMRITKIIEKPKKGNMGNYILSGIYILPAEFITILERKKLNMEKALSVLVKEIGLTASIWEGDWIDVCYPWDILSANKIMMNNWDHAIISSSVILKGDVKISGPVYIEENVEIRSGSVIEGPSFIGAGSFIGNNVLIRKNSSVGRGCTIGYGVELKNCILFGNSRVGRLSFIGDSVIGSNVEVGSGTMTVNDYLDRTTVYSKVNGKMINTGLKKLGAFVGDNAIIGSGHTLMPGVTIDTEASIPHHFTYPKKTFIKAKS